MTGRRAPEPGLLAPAIASGPGSGARRSRSELLGALAAVALIVLASGSASAASGSSPAADGAQAWRIAPAGPCARLDTTQPCSGGPCGSSDAAVRSRFDAADVASAGPGSRSEGAAPPEPIAFQGPGPCADPSTPCGQSPLGRVSSSQPPVGPPTGVIEQPVNPGTLPGGLPGLP